MEIISAVVALTITGTMVGVGLFVATFANAIFDRLPSNGGLTARAEGARLMGRVMPFWYVASIVFAVILAGERWGQPRAGVAMGAVLALVLSIVMSVVVLVPINNRAKAWTPENAPADWQEQLHRWDTLHYVRLVVIGVGFVLVALACIR